MEVIQGKSSTPANLFAVQRMLTPDVNLRALIRWTLQRVAMWMLEHLLQRQSVCTCASGPNASVDNAKQEQCAAAVPHNLLEEVIANALIAQIERQQLFLRGLRSILLQKSVLQSIGKSIQNNDAGLPRGVKNATMSRQHTKFCQKVPVVDWLVRILCVFIGLRQPYRSSIIAQLRKQLGDPMIMVHFETVPRHCLATILQPQHRQQVRERLLELIRATETQTTRGETPALDLSLEKHWHWESKMTNTDEHDAHSSLDVSRTHPLHQPFSPGARHLLPVTEIKPFEAVTKVGTGRLALRPYNRPEDPLVQLRNSSHPLVSPPPAVMLGVHELDGKFVRARRSRCHGTPVLRVYWKLSFKLERK